MGKSKARSASSVGKHKNHGPKRHIHRWTGAMFEDFAKAGVLSKYNDFESWQLAMAARGSRKTDYAEFCRFASMKFEDQKAYFENTHK